jgi:hypothetical protein
VSLDDFDTSWFKDLTDIVKNKTLFFLPCFGAFLAFVFTQSEYIKDSNFVIWLLVGTILLMSMRYIHLVSQLLWAIESTRLSVKIHGMGYQKWSTKEADAKAIVDIMKIVPALYAAEDWWFNKIMYLFALGTIIIVTDKFFGHFLNALVQRLFMH